MFGERPIEDTVRTVRAWATNQVARFAPRAYVGLTGQTGRGAHAHESIGSIAQYFRGCFQEYFEKLDVPQADIAGYLRGKTLLEYGPGDTPGVALLMYAHGAAKVYCVDRFPMLSLSGRNAQVLRTLLEDLAPEAKARGMRALQLDRTDAIRLRPECIEYLVRPSGLSGLCAEVDLAFSRAVLEHVDDLHASFADMATALRPGGVAIHQVDLKSHGLHRRNPLDFLTWPEPLWRAMYSYKGVPNRWRIDRYRDAIAAGALHLTWLSPTASAASADIEAVRPHLAAPFRRVSDEDLACLGFWVVCAK